MVEVKCIVLQRRLYSGQDSLGVAANWCGCCQNVELPSAALSHVIWSDHKLSIHFNMMEHVCYFCES